MTTKIDFVNSAYSMGRISGLTSQPTPEEIVLGVNTLENMAAEWEEKNIDVGYNFEAAPDVNTLHNVDRKYWTAFQSGLMMRLLANFGKEPTAALASMARGAYGSMSSSTSIIYCNAHPGRMPIGSGNRWHNWYRYYDSVGSTSVCPTVCTTSAASVCAGGQETIIAPTVDADNWIVDGARWKKVIAHSWDHIIMGVKSDLLGAGDSAMTEIGVEQTADTADRRTIWVGFLPLGNTIVNITGWND
jgi:hypothetical protein